MGPLSLCINTQTPLLQFLGTTGQEAREPSPGGPVSLTGLREGVDYRYSPGGVTRMVYPLVRRLLEKKVLKEAHWVAFNPYGPRTVRLGELTLHNVAIESGRMGGYGKVKEAIWGRIHEVDSAEPHDDLFWSEAFSEYAYYNRITAELIQKLDDEHDFDVFYVHDFQQLPVGQMLGTLKPRIFRWHIPFDASVIPEHWRSLLSAYLNSYDVIVVSAQRYAESLTAFNPKGRILRLYPYVDPDDYSHPSPGKVAAVSERFGLSPHDEVALVVGRMDPIKGQDQAIEAFAALASDFPRLKLILVGNGSFSGSKSGLGLSKGDSWRTHLEEMVRAAGLERRVVFTGHLLQADLDAMYARCLFTILPSVREGFGLVAVESWLHRKPAIVTVRSGIAELVENGMNGLLFNPGEPGALERQMRLLLDVRSGGLRARLARNGLMTSQKCSLDAAEKDEGQLLAEVAGA
ncbi:MAG TPA: glycosyltransferase family 4 protein [Thermoplasmata archaeon]|nr:glycosyltransferase family 4 protein [Thermoplasmata archaeon]